ncbi:GT4 family glycosyltransferase PelF [Effusibacillus consociatus]|uniref:GT4 family glycosyltransferase PelF n=1 Tax=Effusibacillus consociatus TaxID=1117041 RepID=A0ABV9Q318_9BACL
MKIILLLEGTYPYVQGGVSNWTHQMVHTMKDCQFSLVFIGGIRQANARYRYTLPTNIVDIKEVYLHDAETVSGELYGWKKREQDEMKRFFITGELPSETTLAKLRNNRYTPNAEAIIRVKWAWEATIETYRSLPGAPSFAEFVWNWRSMWLPLLRLLCLPLSEGDLIYSPSTGYAGWYGAVMHRLTSQPFVVTEHGIYIREREEEIARADWIPSPLKTWWNQFFFYLGKTAYQEAAYLTTLSGVNQAAQVKYGADSGKMRLIPNGVDLSKYRTISPTPGRPFTIGAIMRVVPIKDVKTLIRAMAIVVTKIPDAKLMIIGPQDEDPDYVSECLALLDSLGIAESCIWTGPVNVVEYMQNLDCLVLTSISEGQPLVLLEGMAAGMPCISTDVGACRELIEGLPGEDRELGRCGFVTTLMNPEETASALLELAKNPELRILMGRIGRERVSRYYQFDDVMKKYRELFEEAVGV